MIVNLLQKGTPPTLFGRRRVRWSLRVSLGIILPTEVILAGGD